MSKRFTVEGVLTGSTFKSALLTGAGLVLVAGFAGPAQAAKFKLLYSFCSQTGCSDGGAPTTGLTADSSGNLYGMTTGGGANGNGTIFELVKNKKGYTFRLLYSPANCSDEQHSCPDGAAPQGPLVIDTSGNLYGVFQVGGPQDGGQPASSGVLFKVVPGAQAPFQIQHTFCKNAVPYCADGAAPQSGLTYVGAQSGAPYDGTSSLYGATLAEGQYGGGTSYTFTSQGGVQTTHAFCEVNAHESVCTDGSSPSGALAVADSGNLFGTNLFGKKMANGGLVWAQAGTQVLHRFDSNCIDTDCKEGAFPSLGVSLDQASNTLFGTNSQGGVTDHGTAYALEIGSKKVSFAISFCRKTNCQDTGTPSSTLVLDEAGGALGTTNTGGNGTACGTTGCGTLYRIDLGTKKLKVLHSFSGAIDDGAAPFGGAIQMGDNLVGIVNQGGANGFGAVYQLTP